MKMMNFHLVLPIICAVSATRTIDRGHDRSQTDRGRSRRQLREALPWEQRNELLVADESKVRSFTENSEIWQNTEALLVSREQPKDASAELETETCYSPSAQWLRQQVDKFSEDDLSNFFYWHLYTLPFAYKLFVEPERDDGQDQEYCGLGGEYTQEIKSVHEQAQDFWSKSGIDDDIRVLCAHGSDLADLHDKLVPTLNVLFSGSYDEYYTVLDHAFDVQDLISRLPGGYDHPLLTFNAFATDEAEEHDRPSIIIGDGYLEFQRSVGLGYEGPEYALTHEHAHHLQFSLDAQAQNGDKSQNTTRQELMADAFSAYFLAHKSGGDMTAEQLMNIHSVAYSVGDCEIKNSATHHGTPEQRKCATKWGTSVASSRDAANINLLDLKRKFDMWYDESLDIPDDFCEYITLAASCATCFPTYHVISQLVVVLYASAYIFGF